MNIKDVRQQRGLTQRGLAELLGLKQQTISKWELGTEKPSAFQLGTLCGVLLTSPEQLGYSVDLEVIETVSQK